MKHRRLLSCLHLLAILVLLACPARAAGPIPAKLDPRLGASLAIDAEPVSVWVEFVDKGEQGPSDLAARLAEAERNLSPANRKRREWAGVSPIVDYHDLPLDPDYVDALKDAGYSPYGQSRWFNGVVVRTSGASLAKLAALSFVKGLSLAPTSVRPRPTAPAEELPPAAVPRQAQQPTALQVAYGRTAGQLQRLGVPAVHDSGYVGTGILIAVLDDGFNYYKKHEATRTIDVPPGHVRDFVDGDLDVQDTLTVTVDFAHGLFVLSCVGGKLPGSYVGPAYGAQYALARTEKADSETPQELVTWAMGAEWADSLGARIITSSLGYNRMDDPGETLTYPMLDGHTTLVTRAAQIAASRGILVVNSAGNDGNNSIVGYKIAAPSDANGDSVLCIAAVDSNGTRASFSSKGPTYDGRVKPDLAAQGVSVSLAAASGNPNAYTRLSGTSFSCPLTTGLAACLMQARPSWPPTMIIRALRETASNRAHPDTLVGWGIPNALAALRWADGMVDVPDSIAERLSFSIGGNPVRQGQGPLTLRFSLPADRTGVVGRIVVYDAAGRRVATPWSGPLTPGQEEIHTWEPAGLRAGLYLAAFEAGHDRVTRRIVSIR